MGESEIKELVKKIYRTLSDKKAVDIRIIDIRDVTVVADYFLIATANNAPQLSALMDAVDETIHKSGVHSKNIEGNQHSSWVLMDYGDIIVHLFTSEDRLFYDLERIWQDGKTVDAENL